MGNSTVQKLTDFHEFWIVAVGLISTYFQVENMIAHMESSMLVLQNIFGRCCLQRFLFQESRASSSSD